MNKNNDKHITNFGIDLNDLVKKILFHWPIYIILIAATTLGAFIYLRYAKPNYLSSAKLYLKDEKKNGGSEEMDILKSLSIFNNGKNIENEMELLRSPILIAKVIKDNHFNVRYFRKGNLHNEELYTNKPLSIHLLSDSENIGNYKIDVIPDGKRLQVKYVNPDTDSVTQLSVNPGMPFTLGKDQFSLTFDENGDLAEKAKIRIQIDSISELAFKKVEDIGTNLVNKDASVIVVTCEDRVPERAAHFLTALLDAYNEYTLDNKNMVALKTIRFLNVRIDSLKDELGFLEKQEERFKIQRGITDIEGSAKLTLEQVKDADVKLNEANMQLSVFDQVDSYINDPATSQPFAPVLGNVDQTLTSLINRYEELLKERRKLSLSLQPDNIIIKNLDAQVADAQNTVRNYIAGYRRNAGVAKQQMQKKVDQIQGKIANIPAYEREYINIKRQQSVKENLYLFLLKKKEEASVSYASNVTENKVIAPAFVPRKPESPQKTLVFMSFIALGLVLGTGHIYIKYFLTNKVLSKNEIERIFDTPVMAEVYQDEENPQNISLQSRSLIMEQIFNLRTSLRFLLNEQHSSATILITSSISGEGKTFISAHLGNSLTVNNKKVVLLELDLRKPKLSKFFNINNKQGITNYLVDNKSVDDIIQEVPGCGGLFIIPSGPIPPNPIELIESNKMKTLISSLKERFDYLIIDTAPIGIVSDAKSLSAYSDCTLFVVRYNYTLKNKLAAVSANIREGFFRKTGVVFNGIEKDSFHPYFYDQYAYSEDKPSSRMWYTWINKIKQRII